MDCKREDILLHIDEFIEYMATISSQDPLQFEQQVNQKLNHINQLSLKTPVDQLGLIKYMFEATTSVVEKGFMHPLSRKKPFGYSGDFLTMDYAMTQKTESQGEGKLWDEFFHRLPASQAVRNRKGFFYEKLKDFYQVHRQIAVLDVVGGSCRDVRDAIQKIGSKASDNHFHFVDSDKNAISYAQNLLNEIPINIQTEWYNKNIFRFKPSQQYDFVWCLGLFDYLKDHLAVSLIKRFWEWTNKNGKIIFGNFHPRDPSRNWFIWIFNWILIYRIEAELVALCKEAGISDNCIQIQQEQSGINLFCVITKF